MFRLSNIRIGIKLAIMSGFGVILVAAMVATQMMGNASVRAANDAANFQQAVSRDLQIIRASVRGMQIAVRDLRLAHSAEDIQKALAYLDDRQNSAHRLVGPMVDKLRLAENRALMEKSKGLIDGYVSGAKEIATIRGESIALQAQRDANAGTRIAELDERAARIARERTLPMIAELEKNVDTVGTVAQTLAEKEVVTATQSMTQAENIGMVVGFAAFAVLIASAVFGAVTIAKPLRALVRPLEEIAEGNFLVDVPGLGRKDEVGQIASAVGQMAEKVRSAIAGIKASGREVTNASAEISTSTTDLSQRTEEQAASLEETSAAMEELAATVRKNAENAQLANQDATVTREVADRGGAVVAKAVDAMARIEESSRKISDIIGVIDEIARQTNLLALNAAVEAARAGEAGRGFAVVASEVRSLAQRSSQAAKDIKDLITNSNGQVKDGVELVNKAGESLSEIVESIKKVAVVVSDIANASAEQATGIDQINRALSQMDEVTQQNSALVEENAATAKTLEHQAKAMDEQVSVFQIAAGHDTHGYTPAAAMRAEPARAMVPAAKTMPVAKKPVAAASAKKPVVGTTADKAEKKSRAVASAGPARNMQTALATAVNADDWREF